MNRTILLAIVSATLSFPAAGWGADSVRPTASSEACLQCHQDAGGIGNHVYGAIYDRAQQDLRASLRRSSSASGFGSTIANDLLVNGKVECASCHVGHDEAADVRYRLRTPDRSADYQAAYNALCTACHDLK